MVIHDTAETAISCQCHSVLTYRGEVGECRGAILFTFPTRMLTPAGAQEHRIHRSRFMKEMAALYDEKAENLRVELNKMDPETARPPLERLGMMIVDTTAVALAIAEDETEPEGDEDDPRVSGAVEAADSAVQG